MKLDRFKPAGMFEALLQLTLFAGVGVAIAYWIVDDMALGAVFGMGGYLFLALSVIGRDVMEMNRALAAFRNGEEDDFLS